MKYWERMNPNTGKSMITVLQEEYDCNRVYTFLVMLNELYIEAYITLANYITFIIFVICAMFDNNSQRYAFDRGRIHCLNWGETEEWTAFSARMVQCRTMFGKEETVPMHWLEK